MSCRFLTLHSFARRRWCRSAGLTVLTGETGAGKTALLSALKLILGERADSSTVRGEALASVEARLFDGPHDTEGFTVQRSLSAEGPQPRED